MKFRIVIAGAFVCLAATACGGVTHASVPAADDAAVTHQVAAAPVVFDCRNHAVTKPGNYILTCADAGSGLAHLAWTSWTAEQAVTTGVHQLDNCTPNCAEGKFINYPAVITFWHPQPLAGHPGETYFSRITVRYTTAQRPPMYMNYNQLVKHPATWSQTLGR